MLCAARSFNPPASDCVFAQLLDQSCVTSMQDTTGKGRNRTNARHISPGSLTMELMGCFPAAWGDSTTRVGGVMLVSMLFCTAYQIHVAV
jgi:hypothetical protein